MSAIAEISDLLARLVLSAEREDSAGVRACWTANAVLRIKHKGGSQSKLSGRAAIVGAIEQAELEEAGKTANFLAQPIIRVNGDRATARSFIVRASEGAAPQITGFTEIWDKLQQGPDGRWTITERTITE